MSAILYHSSSLSYEGEEKITLLPGPQGAEGKGVYFSEGMPRLSAAEGCKGRPLSIFAISISSSAGWWRTKAGVAKKFNRPRTWHTAGKAITLTGLTVTGMLGDIPVVTARDYYLRKEEK